jgi:hypothetical protein
MVLKNGRSLTRTILDGRDVLLTGLGLAAFMLILLLAPTSGTELNFRPSPELTILLGLVPFFIDPGPLASF